MNCQEAADFFLTQVDDDAGDTISNLKLQKLLYYAQGFHLALFDKPLFNEAIEAWSYGPVVPPVYHRFKKFGGSAIPAQESKFDFSTHPTDSVKLLEDVYKEFGQYSAWRLRDMTHDEPPWKDTPLNTVIPHKLMSDYFKTQLNEQV